MNQRALIHKELQKIKRKGHYYVKDIVAFVEADRRRVVEPLVKNTQKGYYNFSLSAIQETLKNAGILPELLEREDK